MRQISVDSLREEILRLGAVVTETRLLHPSGVRIHGPGEVLTGAHLKLMAELGFRELHLLEPGDSEQAAQKKLGTEPVGLDRLQVGDFLGDDLRQPDGALVAAEGAAVDEPLRNRIILAAPPQVTIRRRGFADAAGPAKMYLGAQPPATPKARRPDTRVTQITQAASIRVRPLMVARARVFVAVREDFHRAVVANTLAAEGHEVVPFTRAPEAATEAVKSRPDAVIVDLAEAAGVCGFIRGSEAARGVYILVCGQDIKAPDLHKALQAGANDGLGLPPRRDVLLDKVRGCLQAMGKASTVKPFVLSDRRMTRRAGGHFACGLVDRFISKPLAVTLATVLDVNEGGLRIEYPVPPGPGTWAYTAHSVHPKHVFYNYSKASPLGRDLTVTIPSPAGPPMDIFARFIHVARNRDYEVAGLAFQQSSRSVRESLSVVRRGGI